MSNTSNSKLTFIVLSFVFTFSGFLFLRPLKAQAREIDHRDQSRANQASQYAFLQYTSTGQITGDLSFPSEHIPPLTIFAMRIDTKESTYYSISTSAGQTSYSIRVDPGVYLVLAYHGDLAGGYTRYVTCGLGTSCHDHILNQVVVEAGDYLNNVDLLDWYAPDGIFPARPDQPSKPVDPENCATYHRVAWGETLYRIGLQYNLTWKPIASANQLSNPNLIFAGQVLCIPGGSSTSPAIPQNSNIPTFEILSVVKNKQVTIETSNFPPHTTFVVTMGYYGTKGINGIEVDSTSSSNGGTFKVSYAIPQALHGQDRIAIRLQSSSGYYSYNWFFNNTTG
ncbi:MAG: LysM peptidoglycan-binding domain-containing protein [Anaerolineales bacterium]